MDNITEAIAKGGELVSLVAKLKELELRAKAIQSDVVALQPVPRLAPAVVEDRLAEWRRLLRGSVTQGRAVLQRILCGRLTFTPRADGEGYDFTGDTRFDKLFTGIVIARPAWIPTGVVSGTEHIGPSDTFDSDYGRLLEQVQNGGKGLASPPSGDWSHSGIEWVVIDSWIAA
jgi:hypothetical protein